jgi:cation transporter-like permease
MLEEYLDKLFGELDLNENHCMLFYYLSMFSVFAIAIVLGRFSLILFSLIKTGNAFMAMTIAFFVFLILMVYFIVYYSYRVSYSICKKVLKDNMSKQL